MRYRCITECRSEYPIRMMARLLRVSSSGYYAWSGRQESRRAKENRRLVTEIQEIHQESDGTYGSPRMSSELRARGYDVSENRVARLMRTAGVRGSIRKRYRVPGQGCVNPTGSVASNVLDRQFTPTVLNRVWAGDITYIRTDEGLTTMGARTVSWYGSNVNRLAAAGRRAEARAPSGLWLTRPRSVRRTAEAQRPAAISRVLKVLLCEEASN